MMKKIRNIAFFSMLVLLSINVLAQKVYKYETVPGDPLKVRMYTLDNGLKVYLTVYKDAPRIQTAIAVRTGSKNDPADNTGLSHYLEHMMFKGSDEFGTMNYSAEKPILDEIEAAFEQYRSTKDPDQRKAIYHRIDSLSGVASTFAIANEYDKLVGSIGAKGTNAFTSNEETVYVNEIPSNKMQPWLDIEYERFKDPVFRLFHTELETVYEEKNMSLDNDDDKIYEALFSGMFPTNTYGTQTTIGTVEHLKNPSLKSLKEYYHARYVPNNMAIIMSGDFNPDEVIATIDATFGKLASKPVTPYVPASEKPITSPVVKDVLGPDAESVTIGFRLGGAKTQDADLVSVFSKVLSNGTAGLIDLNLNQAQKVLEAGSFPYIMTDYTADIYYGKAKEGQSLEEVRDLILSQIELVKKGEFPDWLIPAVINNIKLEKIKTQETNNGRVFNILDGFISDIPRKDIVEETDRLSKITKKDIIDFANKNYSSDYVIIYKRTGTPPETAKVEKPAITSVTMNREAESEFLKHIMSEQTKGIDPVFINFDQDIKKLTLKKNVPVLYVNNSENQTFNLTYYFTMGTNSNKTYETALDYLSFLGTSKFTPSQVQEEFYKLACSFNVNCGDDEIRISLSGLTENMGKGIQLLESIMADAQPNPDALNGLVSDILKRRGDDKLNKNTILWSGLYNYGVYGKTNPYTNILSEAELKSLKPEDLISLTKGLNSYEHKVLYYGPMPTADLVSMLDNEHMVPSELKPLPAPVKFSEVATESTKVYSIDYDMKQVEIIMLSKSDSYDPTLVPVIRLFNEYFGGGMNSVVFQEIRESKGLAYSAYGGYRSPSQPWQHYYLFSYIGTQNDKMPEAMKTMFGIFNNMPESEKALSSSKDAIINKIRTERITKMNIINTYLQAQRFGLKDDIRKAVYEQVPGMNFADLKAFQQKYIKDKKYSILILGKTEMLDKTTLETYGPITPLSLQDVFGY